MQVLFTVKSKPVAKLVVNMPTDVSQIYIYLFINMINNDYV